MERTQRCQNCWIARIGERGRLQRTRAFGDTSSSQMALYALRQALLLCQLRSPASAHASTDLGVLVVDLLAGCKSRQPREHAAGTTTGSTVGQDALWEQGERLEAAQHLCRSGLAGRMSGSVSDVFEAARHRASPVGVD